MGRTAQRARHCPDCGRRREALSPDATSDLRAQLYWSSEVAILTGRISNQYISYLSVKRLLAQRGAHEAMMRAALGLPTDMSAVSSDPVPIIDPFLFAARAERLAGSGGQKSYRDMASMVALEHRFAHFRDDSIGARDIIDIINWRMKHVATGEVDALPGDARLPDGVLETVLESEMMKARALSLGAKEGTVKSASGVLEAALEQGIPLVAVTLAPILQRCLS